MSADLSTAVAVITGAGSDDGRQPLELTRPHL